MADPQSIRLQDLTKEDLKMMAKQIEKAKRDQNAKQAITTFGEPTMPSSVSFDAPVKVTGEDEDRGRLMGVLGRFEDFSNYMRKSRLNDMVGVERQPPTPLPGKSADKSFFKSSSASRNLSYTSSSGSHSRPNKASVSFHGSANNKGDVKYKQASSSITGADGKTKHVPSGNVSKTEQGASRASSSDRTSLQSINTSKKSDQKPESFIGNDHHKLVSLDQHKSAERDQSQSTRKDTVSHSIKHPPVRDREPVLQSINQELTGQSKTEMHQSAATYPKANKSVAKSSESKVADARAVLKEKEENRNADVMNGAKLKNRPKLHIPENVEEMLKEFQVPQLLTGIQTPYKDSKFPFQDKLLDRQDLSDVSKSNKDLSKTLSERSTSQKAPVKTTVPEEIQEKDSSSSSDSSSDSSSEEEVDVDGNESAEEDKNEGFDLDGMIGGTEPQKKSEPVKSSVTSQSSTEKREHRGRSYLAEKVPPLGTTADHTEKQRMEQSCSSSDSSSSGSDSDSESGSGGSDSESDKDVSEDEPEHSSPQGTPQGTPHNTDNMDTHSPASKKWDLKSFLPKKPQELINLPTKPPSCEAPASNKSEPDHSDEETEMKRGADHVSDENPPSSDMDVLSKPMSADEFSPPAPIEHKHILSPIKSPQAHNIKSPIPAVISPMQYQRTRTPEKTHKTSKSATESVVHNKAIENVSYKENSSLTPKSTTDLSKGRRPRKQKQILKSVERTETSDSESGSEIDVVNRSSDSALDSPQKTLPLNSQKSPNFTQSYISMCSTRPSTSSAKRKESRRDKLLKEKDSVKLKEELMLTGVPRKDCDSRKVVSQGLGDKLTDPIDVMLHSFPDQKPLSPIRSVTNIQSHLEENLIRAGLAVSTVKPIPVNGNILCAKGKPTVLVKIDLNLLGKVLCIDKDSKDFLKPKEHLSVKHHKNVTSAKYSLPSVNKSKKVLGDTSKDKISTASKLSANNVSDIDVSERKYVPERESISVSNLTRKEVSKNQVSHEVLNFDSQIVREQGESLSDDGSDSDSSENDSEVDNSKHVESVHDLLSSSNHSSFNRSPLEKKKRKCNTTREADTKRRKTLSKSPVSHQPVSDSTKEVPHVEPSSAVLPNRSQPVEGSATSKRERHNSASSQHSTVSNVSQRSSYSQRSSHSHRSQKRPRLQDEPGQALRSTSASISKSHDRSKTAVVTPVVKNEMNETSWLNGFVPEPSVHNPTAMAFHRSMLTDKEEEERMLSADDYHRKAKKYKYQADDMDTGLRKYVLYLESVLCFIQCGYAMEKDHMITEASNMYKDTYKFVSHQYHQFRIYHDTEASDRAHKLTVLCLRIQSLIYLKLYMLKKNETVKLKRILEDHNSKSVKSSSQHKAPSAPSPHQPSWNRSTGTPSPMSPTPSPANSVCSVGSVGSDITPSKISNGNNGQGQIAPPGSVIVPQRIHSITQKYFSNTCYLIQAHELWDQASSNITTDNKEFFAQLDLDCGPLTLHSSLLHLVRYVKQAISQLNL